MGWVSFSIPMVAWRVSFLVLGIVFDTCDCGVSTLLRAWVSFSIPVLAWRVSFLMLGMIFNTRVGIRVRSSCGVGIVFDTCIYGVSALLSARVSFSIPGKKVAVSGTSGGTH